MTTPIDLAIIGGTGVYRLAALADLESQLPETRYGLPSGPVRIGTLAGKRVAPTACKAARFAR